MALKSQSILITGGCGYIGGHIVKQLSEKGYKPVVLDNLSAGDSDQLLYNEPLIIGDTGDQALVKNIIKHHQINNVIHLAGSIVVPDSIEQPASYYDNNVSKTQRFFETCSENGVQNIIFSSSAAIYGPKDHIITETDFAAPIHPYGRSKLMGEWILQDIAHAKKLNTICLRYFNVAGASHDDRIGQRGAKSTHLIKVAAEVIANKRSHLTIFGTDYPTPDGTCIRDYIHVEDLAAAHICALEHLQGQTHVNEAYNCGYGKGFSVREVLAVVESLYPGFQEKVHTGQKRPGDVPQLVACSQKIQQATSWRPKHRDLRLIIQSACEWEKKLKPPKTEKKWLLSPSHSLNNVIS